jgi:predicted DNA-binding transcriptional regulator AlpA
MEANVNERAPQGIAASGRCDSVSNQGVVRLVEPETIHENSDPGATPPKNKRQGRSSQEPGWYSVEDLMVRYQCSERHIFRLADAGRMPWGVKLGRLRRWNVTDIQKWEEGGCRPVRAVRRKAS